MRCKKNARIFTKLISHTCGSIKLPSEAAINSISNEGRIGKRKANTKAMYQFEPQV